MLFQRPSAHLVGALERLVGTVTLNTGSFGELAFLRRGDAGFAFGYLPSAFSVDEARAALVGASLPGDAGLYEYSVCVTGPGAPDRAYALGRGLRILPLHEGLAGLVGLPRGWRDQQLRSISEALRPAIGDDDLVEGLANLAELYLREEGVAADEVEPATRWLDARLSWSERAENKAVYLRAEAGKGKSTLLASLCLRAIQRGDGPLPVFVALRELTRSEGVSWDNLAARIGVVGSDAESLAAAVKAGLVLLVLDGLDEVSGRYDPAVVRDVLSLVGTHISGDDSKVAISGRTTEAALLDRSRYVVVGVELPEPGGVEFSSYVDGVIQRVAPSWAATFCRVPEPLLGVEGTLEDRDPREDEVAAIRDWVGAVFESLGKDRSLFFVQSLVGAARTYQLDGNRKVLIRGSGGQVMQLAEPSVYDICLLAASLACVREEEKVDPLASGRFTTPLQLDILSWFALLASASDTARATLPLPNALVKEVFAIDPVQENDVFSAVVTQMQKHALLQSSGGMSLRAASWRPAFLSDWVRGALLVRAWQIRSRLPLVGPTHVAQLVARAERARVAFEHLFPLLGADERRELRAVLLKEAAESPEAAGNLMAFLSALPEPDWADAFSTITALPPCSELRDTTLEGALFTNLKPIELALFSESEFVDCTFRGITFAHSDFSGALFSGCTFENVTFEGCDGPVVFANATFRGVRFVNWRGSGSPVLRFEDSDFDATCRFVQNEPISDGQGSLAAFSGCTYEVGSAGTLITGAWHGLVLSRLDGIGRRGSVASLGPEERTLRAMLKTFFPSRVGPGGLRQVRPYIRSSALGRGALPAGAPSGDELFHILESAGFTNGGRANHVYAPWSSVAGASERGVQLRNELNDYLQQGRRGATVEDLLQRIKRAGRW